MAGRKAPKTALVTGANRGIGFEIVRQLAEQGISVLAGARSDKKAQAAGAAFAKIGVTAVPVVLDIAAAKRMPAILAEIERRHGPIDVLVNNAAILIDGPGGFGASLFEMTDDTFRRTWETNVLGPATTMRALLPGMIARGFGRIVNIVSRSVKIPQAELGLSNGARSGLVGFVAGLARQTVGRGVTINNLLPGPFDTDAQREHVQGMVDAERSFDQIWNARVATNPAGRFGQPAELGAYCAFLCSANAGFVTGQNLLIDGGSYPGTY